MKIFKKVQLKIVIFTSVVNRYVLHGRVFVMGSFFNFSIYFLTLSAEEFLAPWSSAEEIPLFRIDFLMAGSSMTSFPISRGCSFIYWKICKVRRLSKDISPLQIKMSGV